MKKLLLLAIASLLGTHTFAQAKEQAEKLVDEGVAYHDQGRYEDAIKRYDQALGVDKDNLSALTEKAYSTLSLGDYEEAIVLCREAIDKHPGDKNLKTVYVTYGNAYDALKKTDKSIAIYDQGIKLFPEYHLLYFNKGVALSSSAKFDDAALCFQKAVRRNPDHGSSHNALARISDLSHNRIPALLAYCRFLVIESQGKRAAENLAALQKISTGNVEKTGENSMTIHVDPAMLDDGKNRKKHSENDFRTTGLILAMDAALDHDEKNSSKTPVEQFLRKFETVCASLKEVRKDNRGFYWDYYTPYFVEMKDKGMVKAFAYIAFSSSGDADVSAWLKSHTPETRAFFAWSKGFDWKKD